MFQSVSVNTKNKKVLTLAIASAVASVLFSFMGAPFLRAFNASAKARLFWSVGGLLVTGLFLFQLTLGAIYVGAVWMTLGAYTELEKRGVSWKKTSIIALTAGLLFAGISFLFATKGMTSATLIDQAVQPLVTTLQKLNPDKKFESIELLIYMPGIFAAALICALAAGLVFEGQVFQMFRLKKEKLASGLKWLEFRLPDLFIWVSLFGFLFTIADFTAIAPSSVKLLGEIKTISINISVFSVAAFFLQGMSVFEFTSRFYRLGFTTKLLSYFLILIWLAPAVCLIGLIDYWADFRKMLRKKLK